MTVSEPLGDQPPSEQQPQDDTALLTAALDHAWAVYDAHVNRMYQSVNYYLVAIAVLATAYASAINGKHYGLAAIFSVAGTVLTVLEFAAGLNEKSSAEQAVPALLELQGKVADELNIHSIRILKSPRGRGLITVAVPGLLLALLVGIGTLIYALIH
jgi:hypothetical protein